MDIKVFLADDHSVVREGLRYLLEALGGIRVVGEAAEGRDAVREVLKTEPDVVIMDIAMPGLNGIEATAQILESRPETRVVILSMYASREHVYRSLKAGARGYLLKESVSKEVADAVHAVYRGSRYLSQKITETVVDDYIDHDGKSPGKSPLEGLSSREREILQLVVEGKSSSEIAEVLLISPKTVETYRSRIMEKLEIRDLPGLVKFAIKHGLTSLE